MFTIGDKVSYPMHGAGTITNIEKKNVLDEIKEYYIITIPVGNITISVPVDLAEDVGVRPIISKDELEDVIETLQGKKGQMPDNWNRRYRVNIERLKTGDIIEVASVVRNLKIMSREKNLSSGDRKMLNNALNLLVSEIILVSNKSQAEVEALIDKYVFN
ncbi:MAG: CarD family transcriptional regulator [Tissierellia bacterium]|nr:CarD family transcriptional regulator [Tissierellia bacterium]